MANSAIVGILRALLTADTAQFDTAMKRSSDSAKVWARDLTSIGRQAGQVGTALSKTLTLPLLAAGAALIKVGADFDKASDTIRSATGATGKELDQLNESFKAVFSTVPDSADNVADAMSDLFVRTGQTGKGLEELTTQMLNLSRVAKTEIGPLTAATTRAFGDWSIATDKQSSALDFLFKASQSTGIGVTRLTELVVQFGAPLRALGFSFEESAALMGKWEKEGVNLETVLSGLRFALGNFAKAGKEPAQALKEVQAAILGAKNESEATAIAFQAFGKRAAVDMSRAIIEGRFNIEQLVQSLKNSKETINSAAKDTLSLSERFTLLKNSASVALEPLSKPLMSALENALDAAKPLIAAIGEIAKAFAALPPSVHLVVIGFAGFLAVIGPLLFGFSQIVLAGSAVIGSFTAQGIATRALSGLQGTLTGTTVGLTGAMRSLAIAAGATAAVLGGALLGAMAGLARESSNEAIRKSAEDLAKADDLIIQKQEELNRATAKGNDLQAQKLRQELELLKQGRERGVQAKDQADVERSLAIEAELLEQANRNLSASNEETTTTTGKLTEAQKRAAEAIEKLAAEMGGEKLRGDVLELNAAIAKLNDEQKKNPEIVERMLAKIKPLVAAGGLPLLSDKAHKLYIKHLAMHDILPKIGTDWDALLPKSRNFSMEIKEQSRSLAELLTINQQIRDFQALIKKGPADLSGSFAATGIQPSKPPSRIASFGQSLVDEFEGFASQLGPTILSALTGGGNVLKSIGALAGNFLGTELSKNFGAVLKSSLGSALGGALNAMLPGIGALLGPLLGKIGAAFKTLGRNVARDMQDAFATQELGFPNLNALMAHLKTLGSEGKKLADELDRAQRRDDEGATRRAMDNVRKFMEVTRKEAEETARVLEEKLGGAFSRLEKTITDFGGKAPAALQPLIRDLLTAKGLTDDQRETLEGLVGSPSWQELERIAEEFGIDLAALGPSFQQAKIDDIALGYARKLTILKDAGADMNGVLAGSKDELNKLAQEALRTGSSLPKSLEPWLQALVDSGELVDENGKKLENLDRFEFTGTLEDAFKDLKGILEEIRDLLRDGLPKAAAEGAQGVRDKFKGGIDVPVRWSFGDLPRFERPDVPGLASGGIVTSPRLVGVGEGGPEAIIPLSRLPEMTSGVRGDATSMFEVHLHNYMDGRRVSEVLIPHLKPAAKRVGVRPI